MNIIDRNGEKLRASAALVRDFVLLCSNKRQVDVLLMRDVYVISRRHDDPRVGDYQSAPCENEMFVQGQ